MGPNVGARWSGEGLLDGFGHGLGQRWFEHVLGSVSGDDVSALWAVADGTPITWTANVYRNGVN